MRTLKIGLFLLLAMLLAGCASSGQVNALDKVQYAYSAAIRWGDFEGAWLLVDPKYREAHPMSEIEFERYKQVQISAYRDLGAQTTPDGLAMREIEIGVINRHTLAERSTRYTERWRYDPEAKTWWLTVGLPDFWNGQ
ncbi:hypothetical protein [Lysobacter sp. CFH 32150]|uniref:hypothetical protein n=1 Tax=Lysobacter sp. CFH 32150 TaxID=2927128 RepID=UPI001FA6BF94|nr:hypothetical protein [Lysobacter sp. CFH 32150]MCI4569137.1 hypothetical protein [Lysobacter sp. CFH 32150]